MSCLLFRLALLAIAEDENVGADVAQEYLSRLSGKTRFVLGDEAAA